MAFGTTSIVVACVDGRIVGMTLLCVCETLAGRFGFVEEVAVDKSARGYHVGIELIVTVLEHAEQIGDERLPSSTGGLAQ